MKTLIKELLIRGLIAESKKTEYEYEVRDIGGADVYYKRKKGEKLWDFIEKEEYDKNKKETK
jgi:hypothetical protein